MNHELVCLPCGHNYTKFSWKEGSVCWFCVSIKNSRSNYNIEHRSWRGWTVSKHTGKVRARTTKEALERDAELS